MLLVSKYENSMGGIVNVPLWRGIAKYSIVFVPDTPAVVFVKLFSTFGSYTSKSAGNFISGFFMSFIFPLPDILSFMVTDSFVVSSVLLIDDDRVNVPVAPLNPTGLPEGSALTSIFSVLEAIGFTIS